MKKLILYSVSALALCGGAVVAAKMMTPTPNSLMMRNIEALTAIEDTGGLPGEVIAANCNWNPGNYCEVTHNGVAWTNSNMSNKKK